MQVASVINATLGLTTVMITFAVANCRGWNDCSSLMADLSPSCLAAVRQHQSLQLQFAVERTTDRCCLQGSHAPNPFVRQCCAMHCQTACAHNDIVLKTL